MELKHQIYETVVRRMIDAYQSHQSVTVEDVSLMLPEDHDTSEDYCGLITDVMNNHTHIDDEVLMQTLALRPTDNRSPPSDTSVLYMRSWTILPDTLRQILLLWIENEPEYPGSNIWTYFADQYSSKSLYVRYIGRVKGAPPITRHEHDAAAVGGILGFFLNSLRQVDMNAFSKTRICEFYRARTAGAPAKVDTLERIAIAFFGIHTLLNTQHGGYYNAYDPGQQAFEVFARYKVGFFHEFRKHTRDIARERAAHTDWLRLWLEEIRLEAERVRCPMAQPLLHTIAQQAIPLLVNSHAIFILIGYDITISEYHHCRGFFNVSRSGDLTKSILCRQKAWACNQQTYDTSTFDSLPFPFINVYPWLNQCDTHDAALRQVQIYMNAVQPIITVTFQRMTTSMAFANFLHFHGIMNQRNDSFIDFVGIPSLCYYLTDEWVGSSETLPYTDTATIVIPHIHPGFERYGAFSVELNKLIDLTWTITLIIGEIAIQFAGSSHLHSSNRATVVQQVWDACNPESDTLIPHLRAAYVELTEIKGIYNNICNEKRRQQRVAVRATDKVALQEAATLRMRQYGAAHHPPNSPERLIQVNKLWKMNFPALHIHINRFDEANWRAWASNCPKDVHYFASAMRYVGQRKHHPLHNALNQYRPQELAPNDETWLQNETLLAIAITRWASNMKRRQPSGHFSSENQKRRRQDALIKKNCSEYNFTERIEGRQIYVPATSPAVFHWQDSLTRKALKLPFPGNIVPSKQKKDRMFYVRFLAKGIGLDLNDQEEPLMYQNSSVIVPLLRMRAAGDGPTLWRLWRTERRHMGYNVEEPINDPESIPANQRRPAFCNTTSLKKKEEFSLTFISETDSLGLLRMFFDQCFPDGGHVNLVAPELLDHFHHISQPIQPILAEFLEQHKDHPFYPEWFVWNSDISNNGRHYYANLQFLRPDARKNPPKPILFRVPNDNTLHRATIISFGPSPQLHEQRS